MYYVIFQSDNHESKQTVKFDSKIEAYHFAYNLYKAAFQPPATKWIIEPTVKDE